MKKKFIIWSAGLCVCTVLGLFFATQLFLYYVYIRGVPISWWEAIRYSLAPWYVWGALTPLIVRAVNVFPLDGRRWRMGVIVHLPLAGISSLLHVGLCATWSWAVEKPTQTGAVWWECFRFFFLIMFHMNVFTYAGIVGAISAFHYYRRYRDREVQTAQLESQLSEARLNALRAQLQPHFLFNTLNAITALMHDDPGSAERMTVRLSELLRLSLDEVGPRTPLRQELEFVGKYLEIEQVRFSDRLVVNWSIATDALDIPVPRLLLQPLVENAIRHGMSAGTRTCEIEVVVRQHDGQLHLEVLDNGPGLPVGSDRVHEGVGMRTARARLQHCCGADFSLTLRNRDGGGCAVEVSFPLSGSERK